MPQKATMLFLLGLGAAALLLGVQSPFRTSNYTAPTQSTETTLGKRINLPLEIITDMARKVQSAVAGKVGTCVHPFETSYVVQSGDNGYVARFMFMVDPKVGYPYGVEADGIFDGSFNLSSISMQREDALRDYEYLSKDGYQKASFFQELPTRDQLSSLVVENRPV